MSEAYKTSEQANYCRSLKFVRQKIADVNEELENCEVTHSHIISDDGWTETEYKLMESVEFLATRNLTIETVESEVGLLSLLNDLRATNASRELIDTVTKIWEDFSISLTQLKVIADKYQNQVQSKLLVIFPITTSVPVGASVSMAENYHQDMSEKLSLIDSLLANVFTLHSTYQNHINKELLEEGTENSQFPIACLPRDFYLKLQRLISTATEYVDRDEKFVSDMTKAMIDYRSKARVIVEDLDERRQLHVSKLENAKASNLLLTKNKELLRQLDFELEEINQQMNITENTRDSTIQEKAREETTIEFLEHTISTTKKNTGLQLKRQRLIRSKRELGKKLEEIEASMQSIQKMKAEKTIRKEEVKNSVENNQSCYAAIQEELEKFASSLAEVEMEAKELQTQLGDIETLHCVKTCPEVLDYFADRPATVKIARSLRDKVATKKISRRKRTVE